MTATDARTTGATATDIDSATNAPTDGALGAHARNAIPTHRGGATNAPTDNTTNMRVGAIGVPLDRLDGPLKVRGAATYAFEWPVQQPAYVFPVQATIAAGRITRVDATAALAEPGVLAVLTHENAPRLAMGDPEIAVLQSDVIAFRGQVVGVVIAETSEVARHAAGLVRLEYDVHEHDAAFRPDADTCTPRHTALFGSAPGDLMDGSPADTDVGDVDAALAAAEVAVDATYSTAIQHHNPMEPHAVTATWAGDELTLRCSSQGVHFTRMVVAGALGIAPERIRVISPHVGGGFGSKIYPSAHLVMAALAARAVPGRAVRLALTRQQMFFLVGYRPAAVQRVRLGADRSGRLTALSHDVVQQTARVKVYAEQVAACSRMMYAAPNRRTTHRIASLDLPVPTIMRGPGEVTGMFALESALDELALAAGLDPIELRIRNEPDVHPESGLPFSSRGLVACLREGARRFGWEGRDPTPRVRRERGWLIGTGVACSSYPSPRLPGNTATIRVSPAGRYTVKIGAADIGTGTWTALTQIAADALGVGVADIDLQIGDTALPLSSPAGFSSGINAWGTSIYTTAARLRELLDGEHDGVIPADGLEVTAEMPNNPDAERFAMYGFGAQFAEVRIHGDTGEIRVRRLLGMFDVGRVINPKTARSQLIGGMTQGLSMALHEHGVVDPRFGEIVNHDFAGYHIAANADVQSIEAYWLGEPDPHTNSMGAKGLGEVCIVGTAAAIANAVFHATGVRVRDLPITLDKLLSELPSSSA